MCRVQPQQLLSHSFVQEASASSWEYWCGFLLLHTPRKRALECLASACFATYLDGALIATKVAFSPPHCTDRPPPVPPVPPYNTALVVGCQLVHPHHGYHTRRLDWWHTRRRWTSLVDERRCHQSSRQHLAHLAPSTTHKHTHITHTHISSSSNCSSSTQHHYIIAKQPTCSRPHKCTNSVQTNYAGLFRSLRSFHPRRSLVARLFCFCLHCALA